MLLNVSWYTLQDHDHFIYSIWMFPKIVVPPNHPLKNRVFHYFHHSFWGFSHYFWKKPYKKTGFYVFHFGSPRISVPNFDPECRMEVYRLGRGSTLHQGGAPKSWEEGCKIKHGIESMELGFVMKVPEKILWPSQVEQHKCRDASQLMGFSTEH